MAHPSLTLSFNGRACVRRSAFFVTRSYPRTTGKLPEELQMPEGQTSPEAAALTPEMQGMAAGMRALAEQDPTFGGKADATPAGPGVPAASPPSLDQPLERRPEGEPSATRPAAGPEVDLSLLQAARRVGLDDEDLRALGSRAVPVLEKLKAGQDRISARLGQIGMQVMGGDVAPSQTPAPPTQPATSPSPPAPEPGRAGIQELNQVLERISTLEVSEDELGDAAPVLTALREAVEGVVRTVMPMRQAMEADVQARVMTALDSFFEGLGPDYEAYFGSGPYGRMDPNSPAAGARLQVLQKAKAVYLGARHAGFDITPEEAALSGLDLAFPDIRQQVTLAQTASQLRHKRGQFLERPSGRATEPPPMTEEEDGLRRMRDYMDANGVPLRLW
jgi:hypothetical protein